MAGLRFLCLFICCSVGFFVSTSTAKKGDCPEKFERFGSSCYYFSFDRGTVPHSSAEFVCNRKSSHLAYVKTKEIFNFLTNKIDANSPTGEVEYWTGGRREIGSTWTWGPDTEKPVISNEWTWNAPWAPYLSAHRKDASTHTMTGQESHVLMFQNITTKEWVWVPSSNYNKLRYICESKLTAGKSCSTTCNNQDQSFVVGDSCYCLSQGQLFWSKAYEDCTTRGLDLVAFETREEYYTVLSKMKVGLYDNIWIGGLPVDNVWMWTQHYKQFKYNPSQFTKWAPGQPDNHGNHGQRFITLRRVNGEWFWNDNQEDRHRVYLAYICETSPSS